MGDRPIIITEGDPSGISSQLLAKEESLLRKISKSRTVILAKANSNLNYPYSNLDFDLLKNHFPKSGLYQIESQSYLQALIQSRPKSPSNFLKPLTKIEKLSHVLKSKITMGKPSAITGRLSYQSLLAGMYLVLQYKADLITLPLSKQWVIDSGVQNFRGHTEALAEFFQCPTFMLMAGAKWNVIPLTTHIPISKVNTELKLVAWRKLFQSIIDSKLFPSNPKLAFLGLNPHAGEGGKIGVEEQKILKPAMKLATKMGFVVEGPISADSAFHLTKKSPWDILLSCYHDQGLIPFKLLEGKKGVNLTLGLPFIRVSPDHGPAYDIAANLGKVDSMSLRQCLSWVSK